MTHQQVWCGASLLIARTGSMATESLSFPQDLWKTVPDWIVANLRVDDGFEGHWVVVYHFQALCRSYVFVPYYVLCHTLTIAIAFDPRSKSWCHCCWGLRISPCYQTIESTIASPTVCGRAQSIAPVLGLAFASRLAPLQLSSKWYKRLIQPQKRTKSVNLRIHTNSQKCIVGEPTFLVWCKMVPFWFE